MRPLVAVLASLLAIWGCARFPEGAQFKCATVEDCVAGEACVDHYCQPSAADAGRPGGDAGPVAGRDASEPGADASEPGLDAAVVSRVDAALSKSDVGQPEGPDASFVPRSCRDYLDLKSDAQDGYAVIYTEGDAGVEVYCLHSIQPGGWTLAARSSPVGITASPAFGWYDATGDVRDLSHPYSLAPLARQMAVGELLVTSQDDSDTGGVGYDRYHLTLPATWAEAKVGVEVASLTDVSINGGGCPGQNYDGNMLRHVGCTSDHERYHLRDQAPCVNFGLEPHQFWLAYASCSELEGAGGNLHLKQGLIFIR